MTRLPKASFLAYLILSLLPVAHAGNELEVYAQAQKDFAAKKFESALSGFQSVVRTRPRDSSCHYYLALCYQNLNKMGAANLEYQWIVSNSADPRMKAQAQQALSQLAHYKPPAQITTAAATNSAAPRQVAQAGDFAKGKIKVIEFNTRWCHVCKIYDPVFDKVQHSNKYNSSCDFQQLDAEAPQNQRMVEKYGITGFPTTIFADSSGKQIARFSGGTSPAGLMSYIDSALQKVPR